MAPQLEQLQYSLSLTSISRPNSVPGAIALVDAFVTRGMRFITVPVECSGMEVKITDCIEDAQFTESSNVCAGFGTASIACQSES